jgi:hypothetical protein
MAALAYYQIKILNRYILFYYMFYFFNYEINLLFSIVFTEREAY